MNDQMVFLEFDIKSKQIVEIHEKEPVVTEGYAYGKSNDFIIGDEFEKTIWIHSVDEAKKVTSYSAIRNNPHAERLLKENEQLKHDNALLKAQNNALAERADFIEDVIAEMATQVYQ